MDAPTLTIAALDQTAPCTQDINLDARLALVGASMTLRLEETAVAFEVNTAHIPSPASIAPPHTGDDPTPSAAEAPGPIARILAAAIDVLAARGWAATGPTCRTPDGRLCLVGVIRVAAGCAPDDAGDLLAARAASFLLDVIRTQYPTAATLPSWNDGQRNGDRPLRLLRQAAALATALGI